MNCLNLDNGSKQSQGHSQMSDIVFPSIASFLYDICCIDLTVDASLFYAVGFVHAVKRKMCYLYSKDRESRPAWLGKFLVKINY